MTHPIELNQILVAQPTLFDRSHWGQIRLTGADRVRFLHNQTTNNIEQLQAGQGCHTVFVTSTGRTLDLASVYALQESLLVCVSPNMAKPLYDWMDRYIFFSDKVTLADESDETFLLTLMGEHADAVIQKLGVTEATALAEQVEFTHEMVTLPDTNISVRVAVGSDLAVNGYTLIGQQADKDAVSQLLCSSGATVGTARQWEQLRIQQGRPMPAHELTDDDNPLEAGLWQGVSFEKGCYIGQETIARLNTYQGVKKRLWGLVLEAEAPVGTALTYEGKKVGKLTSITCIESTHYGLAYLRTKTGGEGLTVDLDGVAAQVVSLPFVTHQYYSAAE